ncbi:MAG: bifunctional UDP-N-acetylglucosamine diphosphorylase/glucosamine-1-phosphate N-acetyltransferase GlmU [Clostridiales bacterium]|nr:bifunctional UDP-N-acetylglucosamine diphosphorylase/glucosamine-1-phosphate N-acetyltransferase GlmU [Clostridiales bacterium]
MTKEIYVIIMAAGEGKRMKGELPKVLHGVCGRPIIDYILCGANAVSKNKPILIVGHGEKELREYVGSRAVYARQENPLGTGHAVMMAKPHIEGKSGYAVVLAGDTPLIRAESLEAMIEYTIENGYSVVGLSTKVEDPTGYGRIVRDENGDFKRIVEHRDATDEERAIDEINASMYCFKIDSLLSSLGNLKDDNVQGEYYLTDTLSIIKENGEKVGIYCLEDHTEILGVNTREQLGDAMDIMRRRINKRHMENGVTLVDPENTYIDSDVTIGVDTIIYPGNVIEGDTIIGSECVLYQNNRIVSSRLGDRVEVGPFAYIRPNSDIDNDAKIGNFVEVKNSYIGKKTKASHLVYVGDADVGENVNIGCGAVFVNYDGNKKYRTIVGDNCFIGCNVNLVAPVTIEDDSFIAAGSTITKDVPKGALGIARSRQENKEGWVFERKND